MRKPTICMGENKDADQLRGNREADQRLCFRYTDSTFPPLLIPKFSRFWVSSVTVQAGLCWTWSETQIVGFATHRLIYKPVLPVEVAVQRVKSHSANRVKDCKYMSHLVEKPTMWFPNRPDTNRAVQSQKRARSLKFWS